MIQVSTLLSVMNQMGRNAAPMFYHEIIKIRNFIQGSLINKRLKITYILEEFEICAKSGIIYDKFGAGFQQIFKNHFHTCSIPFQY